MAHKRCSIADYNCVKAGVESIVSDWRGGLPASFMESYMDFATVKGASRKMILDHGKNKRQIFCIGAISIDVEAKPDPRGSTVDLGAYWSSAREDPRYCRSALG